MVAVVEACTETSDSRERERERTVLDCRKSRMSTAQVALWVKGRAAEVSGKTW
jgi:hypothetical protein